MSENIKNESIVTEGAAPEEVAAQVAEQPKEGEAPVVASASTEGNAEPGAPDLAQMEDVPREEDPEERDAPDPSDMEREALRQSLRAMAMDGASGNRRVAPPRPGVFRSKRNGQGTTIDREGAYNDPEVAARREAEIEIYQSYLRKRVLTGRVIGVRRNYAPSAAGKMQYYAMVMTDKYQVLIPYDRFTDTDFEALCMRYRERDPNKTVEDTLQKYLNDRLNAEVDFTISHVATDDDPHGSIMVAGDRLDAMYRQRVYHWFGTNRTTGEFQLQPGSKVEARIIMTAMKGIRVEVFGVETFIRSRDLDYTFIQDARTEFEVGKRVWVVLTDIQRDKENDYAVEFQASVRDAKPDPREKGMGVYLEGSVFVGEINYTQYPTPDRPNVRPAVFVKLPHEGIQVSCPFPSGPVPPTTGAKCYVTITNRDLRKNKLYGRINHIVPTN